MRMAITMLSYLPIWSRARVVWKLAGEYCVSLQLLGFDDSPALRWAMLTVDETPRREWRMLIVRERCRQGMIRQRTKGIPMSRRNAETRR
jgi:hypothetical protein